MYKTICGFSGSVILKKSACNPSSPKGEGVATTLQTVFAPVLKNAQPRDKIAPGIRGGGGGVARSRDFKFGLF